MREVSLTIEATVDRVPEGTTELRIWIPVPRDEGAQALLRMIPEAGGESRLVMDTRGNAALLVVIPSPAASAQARATFEVSRAEQRGAGTPHPLAHAEKRGDPDAWLADEPMTGFEEIAREAAPRVFSKARTPSEKARAAWDLALERGGSPCFVPQGLFLALLHVEGVPARPVMGFALPEDAREGTLDAYHCWAEWWNPDRGWTPVDPAAALADPARRDFYFGNLDADRVSTSRGRGIRLGQTRPLLDFVFPHAEADGRSVRVSHSIRFRERD